MSGSPWKRAVGLTGGLGSGKSTVLQMFREKGAVTTDADKTVRGLLENKQILKKIRRTFGPDVFAGKKLDRKKMAGVIFKSNSQRKKLEGILHPLVRRATEKVVRSHKKKIVVCDIPLLFETGQHKKFGSIIVVSASTPVRVKRLLRKGFPKPDIRARMKAQWPLARKEKKADFVIHNSGTKKQTQNQVNKIWHLIIDKTSRR